MPTIVFKSFKLLDKNAPEIRSWMDLHEKRTKDIEDQLYHSGSRADTADAALKEVRERLGELFRIERDRAEQQRKEAVVVRGCIGNLLRVNNCMLSHFGNIFGEDIGALDDTGTADDACSARDDSLQELESLGSNLEGRLGGLATAFGRWEELRAADENNRATLESGLAELQCGAEQMQSRLLAWRDLLKENSAIIEALNAQLDTTKFAVHELQASQVRLVDVDGAVGETAKRLEDMHSSLESRVDGVAHLLDEYAEGTDNMFEEARRLTDAQINEHSSQVAKLLEKSLHPINAYLNTMAAKADKARAELDSLNAQVPELVDSLRGVSVELQASDHRHDGRADELAGELREVSAALSREAEAASHRRAEISEMLRGNTENSLEQIRQLQVALRGLEQALETLKQKDVSGLAGDLRTLEHKVAQWVHAHPLPAKVSEARLYSLEARLNEEMNARLMLETSFKSKPDKTGTSHRTSDAVPALPQLLPPPPAPVAAGYQKAQSARTTGALSSARRARAPVVAA